MGCICLCIAYVGSFCLLAFYDTDPEVYQFPRIIAIVLVLLALIQSLSAFRNSRLTDQKTISIDWMALLPGLIVGFLFVMSLEVVGFYTCAFLSFLALVSLYGKRRILDPKALVYKLMIGGIFILILYGMFWKLLYVRTPTGWFF